MLKAIWVDEEDEKILIEALKEFTRMTERIIEDWPDYKSSDYMYQLRALRNRVIRGRSLYEK